MKWASNKMLTSKWVRFWLNWKSERSSNGSRNASLEFMNTNSSSRLAKFWQSTASVSPSTRSRQDRCSTKTREFVKSRQQMLDQFFSPRVSTDFHYNNSITLPPWFDGLEQHDKEPPWRPIDIDSSTVIDFRLRSCGRQHMQGGYDGPDVDDPTIPQYDESNIFQALDGILAIVHSPDEYPLNNGQLLYIAYWSHNEWMFYPEKILIDDEIKLWPLEMRNCYLPGEKKLTFFKIYTKNNCEHECLSISISDKCGCVPFYMIRKNIT